MTQSETSPMPLDSHGRRKFFQFNPNIDSGTLLNILVMVIGGFIAYGTYTSDKALQTARITAVEKEVIENKGTVKEAVTDLKGEVKDVQRTLRDVNESLAVLKARPSIQPGK